VHSALQDQDPQREKHQPSWIPSETTQAATAIERHAFRRDRDLERGYRINIKQIVLAFVVEFFIIGIVLTGQYLYAVQIPNASRYVVMQTMLFPVALAMVELARVPLAVAVRIQKSWNIQFAALLGVACAVVVTSASLYQIGNFTFNPRLERVHDASDKLTTARQDRVSFLGRKRQAQDLLDQKTRDWNVLSERYATLSSQLNAQPGHTCTATPTTKVNSDGTQTTITTQACKTNPALKALQSELSDAKLKIAELDTAKRQAQADLAKYDQRATDDESNAAEAKYRDAVYQSPLHSYTAMLFNKDPQNVTEGEVKTLEWYLILIPSIAAALSSTLIAMTAVHRIRRAKSQAPTTMPDEAMGYLLGPLVKVLEQEARTAISAAAKSQTAAAADGSRPTATASSAKAKPPPEMAKA